MTSDTFAARQLQLTAEFGKYVFDHPEFDDLVPDDAYVYFEVEGDDEFNRYSHRMVQRHSREEGATIVLVRVKGLLPPQGSRLIEPVLQQLPAATPKRRKQRHASATAKSTKR